MSKEIYWVFVSSSSDLMPEREAIREVIREEKLDAYFYPYRFEHDGGPGRPERQIRREIKASDLFIVLLAERFGSHHPRSTLSRPMSIVQWEFRTARRRRPRRVIAFVKQVEINDENQRRFVEEVTNFCTGEWKWSFESRRQLKPTFRQAFEKWMADRMMRSKRIERWTVRYGFAISGLCALLLGCRELISGPSYYFVASMLVFASAVAPLVFVKFEVMS